MHGGVGVFHSLDCYSNTHRSAVGVREGEQAGEYTAYERGPLHRQQPRRLNRYYFQQPRQL